MIYRRSLLLVERSRRKVTRVKPREAILGDGTGNIYAPDGMYWVRFSGPADENGNATYAGTASRVFGGAKNFIEQDGRGVKIVLNYKNQPEIDGPVYEDLQAAGIKPSVIHANSPYRQFVRTQDIQNFLARPLSKTSMKVRVGELFYVDRNGVAQWFPGSTAATHVDLTASIPATADYECFALVSFDQDAFASSTPPYITVSLSTPQTMLPSTLGIADVREAYVGRVAYSLPIQIYHLYNAMPGLGAVARDGLVKDIDNRQWVNVPLNTSSGDAPASAHYVTTQAESGLSAEFNLGALTTGLLKHSVTAGVSTPATAVSNTDYVPPTGAILTSPTINTGISGTAIDNDVTLAADSSTLLPTQHAVKAYVDAITPGMASWTLAGDSGTPQTILDGNTAMIAGGAGIDTVASATDTVTVSVSTGGIVGTMIAAATITLDKITAGTPFSFLAYDVDGFVAETNSPDEVNGEAGEDLDLLDSVIEDLSSGTWFKSDTTAPNFVMSGRTGIVFAGTLTTGGTIRIRTRGGVNGFSGLTSQADQYASTTPGILTETPPTPSLGGATVLEKLYGFAPDPTVVFLSPGPARYMRRASLANGASLTVTHHADPLFTRKVSGATAAEDVAIIEASGGAQDTARQLKGQSGAGSTNAVDASGASTTALGDTGGTDFRLAQSFQVTAAGQLTTIVFRSGATTGTPSTATVPYRIETDAAGIPSGTVLASGSTPTWVASGDNTITVTNRPFLVTGITYWFVLELATMQATGNFYTVVRNTAGAYASGLMKWDSTAGASFPNTWAGGAGTNDMRVSITVAAVVVNDSIAQGASHSATTTVPYVDILLKGTGSATGNLTLEIQTNSAGMPSGTAITNGVSAVVLASSVGTGGYVLTRFTFSVDPSITASTQYHLVLKSTASASNVNYIEWGTDASSPPYANGALALLQSAAWGAASPAADGLFDMYGVVGTFGEPVVCGRWSGGTRDLGVRYDDGTGADTATSTTFENTSGITLDVTCIVEMA